MMYVKRMLATSLILFLLLVAIGLVIQGSPSHKAEINSIKEELSGLCYGLNNPKSLSGPVLHTKAMIFILWEGGANWAFDRYSYENSPRSVALVGWVPGDSWRSFYFKDKRYLLADLEISMQKATRQTKSMEDGSFRIEIRDMRSNKLLAERKPSIVSDRFRVYE